VYPVSVQTFDTPNCVLEDRFQSSTVHIPNLFCEGHLHLINCVGIVLYCNRQVHRDFLITLYIRYVGFINCSDSHKSPLSPSSLAQHTRLCPVVPILLNAGLQVYEACGGAKSKSPFFYLVVLLYIIIIFPFFKDLFHRKYVQHTVHSLNHAS